MLLFPQLAEKRPFFDVCLKQATGLAKPLLLVGDLNTGRNDIDLEQGATKFSRADQFDHLTSRSGMIDLWRKSNGFDAREWTWRSHKSGFRIDHALGNAQLESHSPATACWYDHSPRICGLTDHSALIILLGHVKMRASDLETRSGGAL
jgi:exonuclease III